MQNALHKTTSGLESCLEQPYHLRE